MSGATKGMGTLCPAMTGRTAEVNGGKKKGGRSDHLGGIGGGRNLLDEKAGVGEGESRSNTRQGVGGVRISGRGGPADLREKPDMRRRGETGSVGGQLTKPCAGVSSSGGHSEDGVRPVKDLRGGRKSKGTG